MSNTSPSPECSSITSVQQAKARFVFCFAFCNWEASLFKPCSESFVFDSSSLFFPSCDLEAGIFFNRFVASLVEVQKANRKLSASSMKLRFRKGTRLFNSSYQKTFWGWPDMAQAGTYSLQASQHSLKKMKVYSRNHKTFAGWLGGAQAVAYLVQVSNYLPNNRRHKRTCTHLKR